MLILKILLLILIASIIPAAIIDEKYLYGGKQCVKSVALLAKVREWIRNTAKNFVRLALAKAMYRNG